MTNCMTKKMLLVGSLSVSLLATAYPANAFDKPDQIVSIAASNVIQSENSAAGLSVNSKDSKKICMAIPALSGSRMPSRKCKTKAEWESLGYEFGEKK